MENMWLMCKDIPVAYITDSQFDVLNSRLLPLYLQKTNNFVGWLTMRAIDEHRTNSRLLKKALRLDHKDDVNTVLHFNAVTITDSYWTKPEGSDLSYADVRFTANQFDMLALKGDINSFGKVPSRTPELTNTGSFEKCWRLIDGDWWMYKSGSSEEVFTELFAYHLAVDLGINIAVYECDGAYIRTKDFTGNGSVNLEPAYSIIGDESDYLRIYDLLAQTDASLAESFVTMCYFDALIFNMDRHEHNFGVLRDVDTGSILGMAPLYDHNIALVTRGYPRDIERKNDRLIADFVELIEQRSTSFVLPKLTAEMVDAAIRRVDVPIHRPAELGILPENFVRSFILNGQQRISELITAPEHTVNKLISLNIER